MERLRKIFCVFWTRCWAPSETSFPGIGSLAQGQEEKKIERRDWRLVTGGTPKKAECMAVCCRL